MRRSAQAISSLRGQIISQDRAVYSPLSINAFLDAEAVAARSVWIGAGPWWTMKAPPFSGFRRRCARRGLISVSGGS